MTALALPRQMNWPRVTALSGTMSLHVLAILMLLTPPVAIKMMRPLADKPTIVDVVFPPEPVKPIPADPETKPPKVKQIAEPVPKAPVHTETASVIPTAPPSEMQYPASPQGPSVATDITPVETKPTALAYHTQTRIAYPIHARRRGEHGMVRLRGLVGTDGLPQAVEVEQSSGSRSLDNAARAAVAHWTFQPGTRGGVAYAAWASISIQFDLSAAL